MISAPILQRVVKAKNTVVCMSFMVGAEPQLSGPIVLLDSTSSQQFRSADTPYCLTYELLYLSDLF